MSFIKKKSKSGINSGAKIDFNAFIIGIEVIARLILPNSNPKDAIDYVINEHLLKYLSEHIQKIKSSEMKIDYLKEKQNNSDLVYVLNIVHKAFLYVFKFYSNQQGLMNFEQFMK